MREARSFCRTCIAGCGVILTIDDEGQIASMRGDRDHPISEGYVCFKGLQGRGSHHGHTRLLHSLKRMSAIPVNVRPRTAGLSTAGLRKPATASFRPTAE